MANWGIAAEVKRHRDLHRVIDGLAKKIESQEAEAMHQQAEHGLTNAW